MNEAAEDEVVDIDFVEGMLRIGEVVVVWFGNVVVVVVVRVGMIVVDMVAMIASLCCL